MDYRFNFPIPLTLATNRHALRVDDSTTIISRPLITNQALCPQMSCDVRIVWRLRPRYDSMGN
jgi:hypothetical protein